MGHQGIAEQKRAFFLILSLILAVPFGYGRAQVARTYYGLQPPGKVAIPFAPEFFAAAGEGHRFGLAITDNGNERYYAVAFNEGNRFHEEIRFTRFENGTWTAPKPLLDEKVYKYVDPHLSPDGKRMYFISTKPAAGAPAKRHLFDIYYMNRDGDGWSDPVNLGSPFSTPAAHEYYVSLTLKETIYFGSNRADTKNFDLYSASLEVDGKYQKPERLRGNVNTKHYEADVFVSPDETFLVFSSSGREDSLGQGDLYASFRSDDGSWSEGVNLGRDINSKGNDFAPSLSRDGKYLFYSRGGVIHWVDAAVINELKPTASK